MIKIAILFILNTYHANHLLCEDDIKKLLLFLKELEDRKIYYKLEKVREAIMVVTVVPGERWEIEFFDDGHVEIEKFISNGTIYNEDEIATLFNKYSD